MKKYWIVPAVILPLLGVVLLRSLTRDHFRNDAAKWAAPSVNSANLLPVGQLDGTENKALIINLDDSEPEFNTTAEILHIPANLLLEKDNREKLLAWTGKIVLFSSDPALTARMWMLLSQMGHRNLYILDDNSGNEVLKYKFRPDSLTGPEL